MNGSPLRRKIVLRLTVAALLGLSLVLLGASAARSQYCTPDQCDECSMYDCCSKGCCHSAPEFWLINTRCAPRCRNLDAGFEKITYKRWDARCCRWVRETRESFLADEANRPMPTLIYSHGNTLKAEPALKAGWELYNKLRCCPGKKRLVFWSWPAERVYKTRGLRIREMILKNLRLKFWYSEHQGYYMAKLVQQMTLRERVMLSGHSYGAIQAAAAAHYLGGGRLQGRVLEGGAPVERKNFRVGIISGAFDYDFMNPGNRYGQAFVAAEKVFNTRNIHDRTLKKWPRYSWRNCQAIGHVGINARKLGKYRHKLCQQTTWPENRTSHYQGPHLKNQRFVNALCCLAFGNCKSCTKDAEPAEDVDTTANESTNDQPTSAAGEAADATPVLTGPVPPTPSENPAVVDTTATTATAG